MLFFRFLTYSGPSSYDNEEKTTFRYALDHQPMSRRGYTVNARTEKREVFVPKVIYRSDLLDYHFVFNLLYLRTIYI